MHPDKPSRSRGLICPGFAISLPSPRREGAGKAGRQQHPQPRVQDKKHTSVVTTGSARTTRLSPRNGVTASFVLSPVKRPFLPPSLSGTYHTA